MKFFYAVAIIAGLTPSLSVANLKFNLLADSVVNKNIEDGSTMLGSYYSNAGNANGALPVAKDDQSAAIPSEFKEELTELAHDFPHGYQSVHSGNNYYDSPLKWAEKNSLAVASESEIRNLIYQASFIAINKSSQIKSAIYDINVAEENINEAKGQRLPQVEIGGNTPSLQFGDGEKYRQSNIPTLAMKMSTTIYDFGETQSLIDTRKNLFDAATNELIAKREELALEVGSVIIEISKQRLIIDISKQYFARMNHIVSMLHNIVKTDRGRRSELTQAKSKLLQAKSYLDSSVSQMHDYEILLLRLIGDKQLLLPSYHKWKLTPASTNDLMDLIEKHPVVKKHRAELSSALHKVDAVSASTMPKFNWTVNKNTGEDQYGRKQSWQTGININWKIYNGGSTRAAEMAAVNQAESAREMVQQQFIDLRYSLRIAAQEARAMSERASLYENINKESDLIRHALFEQWYHLGKSTLLDVLTAESDFYNSRVSEISNRFGSYAAIFEGYASAGTLLFWLKNGKLE